MKQSHEKLAVAIHEASAHALGLRGGYSLSINECRELIQQHLPYHEEKCRVCGKLEEPSLVESGVCIFCIAKEHLKSLTETRAALHKCYAATGHEVGDLDDFMALLDRENHAVLAVQEMRRELDKAEEVAEAMTKYAGKEAEVIKKLTTLRAEKESLALRCHAYREALEQKIQGRTLRQYMFEQFPATDGHIPFMVFCGRQEQAIESPTSAESQLVARLKAADKLAKAAESLLEMFGGGTAEDHALNDALTAYNATKPSINEDGNDLITSGVKFICKDCGVAIFTCECEQSPSTD